MSAHNPEARAEAAARAVVLFGPSGRTVDSYRPTEDDLAIAAPASPDGCRRHVRGPHLRVVRSAYVKNKTGIVGISFSRGANGSRHVYVNLGQRHRKFSVDRLGMAEAMRRAIALRKEHVRKLIQANAAILAARAKNGGAL